MGGNGQIRLEWLDPADLRENPSQWRTHPPAQLHALEAAIREVGWAGALLLNERTWHLVDGHGRKAITEGKGEKVPVLIGSWSEEQEKLILATLDPLGSLAEADTGKLDELLRQVRTGDETLMALLEQLAEDNGVLDGLAQPEIVEDEVPEPQAVVVTKPGDLWILGDHRLFCSDCRDPEAWERLLGGERVNVVMTSPPYASQRKYDESSGFKPIPPDEYVAWWELLQACVRKHLADDGSFFVNIKPHMEDGQRSLYVSDLLSAMVRQWQWRFVDELCWLHQGFPISVDCRFKNRFEPIYQFCCEKTTSIRFKNVGLETSESQKRTAQRHKEGYRAPDRKSGFSDAVNHGTMMKDYAFTRPGNVIELNNGQTGDAQKIQSATFPVGLPSFFYRAFSDPGDIVADPFMGSGTSLVAAEQLGRKSRGIEISAGYTDVSIRRWQNLTGRQAILESTGQPFQTD